MQTRVTEDGLSRSTTFTTVLPDTERSLFDPDVMARRICSELTAKIADYVFEQFKPALEKAFQSLRVKEKTDD